MYWKSNIRIPFWKNIIYMNIEKDQSSGKYNNLAHHHNSLIVTTQTDPWPITDPGFITHLFRSRDYCILVYIKIILLNQRALIKSLQPGDLLKILVIFGHLILGHNYVTKTPYYVPLVFIENLNVYNYEGYVGG